MRMGISIGSDYTLTETLENISERRWDEFRWNYDKNVTINTLKTTVRINRPGGFKISIEIPDRDSNRNRMFVSFELPKDRISYVKDDINYVFTIRNGDDEIIIYVDKKWNME